MRVPLVVLSSLLASCAHPPPPASPPARAARLAPPAARPEKTPAAPACPTPSALPAEAAPGEIPKLGVAWNQASPVTLVAASPDRRWLALCAATRDTNGDSRVEVSVSPQGALSGDALDGFFVSGDGAVEPIESFVGSDPTGRFVAFVASGRLLLRDTTTRVDTDLTALGADSRDDQGSFVHPRAGAFDAEGKRFLYLRKDAQGSRVVVRELATGAEAQIVPPEGELFRADFDASSAWVVLRVVTEDTNHDGRIEWPVPEAPKPSMRCRPPLPRYAVWERPRDDATPFAARVTGGVAVAAQGLVIPFGDSFVVRDADGTLAGVATGGARKTIAKKSCAAHLLHADATRSTLLVTCAGKGGKNDALLVGPDGTKALGLSLAAAAGDHVLDGTPRLVPLHPGTDAVLVDLDHGTVENLGTGDRILATSGTRALVLRGRSLLFHELGGHDLPVLGEVDPLAHVLRSGGALLVPPLLVDLTTGTLVGTTSARPLAVSVDGALLVPDHDPDATHFATGPLRWIKPN